MMALDECIAAARLPIQVRAVPYKRFGLGEFPRLLKHDCRFMIYDTDDGDEFEPWDWREATRSYVALRTRLSEQQGEKR